MTGYVRNAQESDIERMTELYQLSNPHNNSEEIKQWTLRNYNSPPPLSFVFEHEGTIYGAATGKIRGNNGSAIAILEDIVADRELVKTQPLLKDTKIGQILLDTMVNAFASYGLSTAELLVYTDNQKAIDFYKKNGWEIVYEFDTQTIPDPDLHNGHRMYVMEYTTTSLPTFQPKGIRPIEKEEEMPVDDTVPFAALIP